VKLEDEDLPYHAKEHWLSQGKALKRFFELRNGINKGKDITEH